MIHRRLPTAFQATALSILAASLLSGCLIGGDGGSDPSGLRKDQGTYRIEGGNIINGNRVRANVYCDGSNLVTELDTLKEDTIPFELSGNTLSLLSRRLDTLASGAVVQRLVIEAARVGRGSGISGLWRYTRQTYRVVSGAMSADEKASLDTRAEKSTARLALVTFQVQFSGNTITTFEETQTAQVFLLDWNETPGSPIIADSARYDIAVKVIGVHDVELTGRISGEVVRLTLENDKSETYASSNPAHALHHYSRPPKSCPNESEPEWYRLFLSENSRRIP